MNARSRWSPKLAQAGHDDLEDDRVRRCTIDICRLFQFHRHLPHETCQNPDCERERQEHVREAQPRDSSEYPEHWRIWYIPKRPRSVGNIETNKMEISRSPFPRKRIRANAKDAVTASVSEAATDHCRHSEAVEHRSPEPRIGKEIEVILEGKLRGPWALM